MDEQTPLLPLAEPTTLDEVKGLLRIPDDDDVDDVDLVAAVEAACAEVRGLPVAIQALGLTTWPPTLRLGATRLAAAMAPHRKTQKGAPVFTVDDPLTERLLQRGPYARPAVG